MTPVWTRIASSAAVATVFPDTAVTFRALASSSRKQPVGRTKMNLTLWIAQGLLAAIFLFSGSLKIGMAKERMIATGQTGVAPFPVPLIRVTAASELLAVLGLLLPLLTGIAPVLTPIAALGLVVVMVGAIASHLSLHEFVQAGANTFILLICVFVAVGRLTGH
jgi:uncharacterized membrane protein YphA (DoxX/SURF4 family)